jgi:hypothetical protein
VASRWILLLALPLSLCISIDTRRRRRSGCAVCPLPPYLQYVPTVRAYRHREYALRPSTKRSVCRNALMCQSAVGHANGRRMGVDGMGNSVKLTRDCSDAWRLGRSWGGMVTSEYEVLACM